MKSPEIKVTSIFPGYTDHLQGALESVTGHQENGKTLYTVTFPRNVERLSSMRLVPEALRTELQKKLSLQDIFHVELPKLGHRFFFTTTIEDRQSEDKEALVPDLYNFNYLVAALHGPLSDLAYALTFKNIDWSSLREEQMELDIL